jgi:hypothetical protein
VDPVDQDPEHCLSHATHAVGPTKLVHFGCQIPSEVAVYTLKERRHQAHMVQTYKLVTGKNLDGKETWFKSVRETGRFTRSAADPLNLWTQASQRVIEGWNKIHASFKTGKECEVF